MPIMKSFIIAIPSWSLNLIPATSSKATYKIEGDVITFTYTDDNGDGTTSNRVVSESFEEDGDTIRIGSVTLRKANKQ